MTPVCVVNRELQYVRYQLGFEPMGTQCGQTANDVIKLGGRGEVSVEGWKSIRQSRR